MYVAQQVARLKLTRGLDLNEPGGRALLIARILVRIFHTDGVIHEGMPSAQTKLKLAPIKFELLSLHGIDFGGLLGRYYETLFEKSQNDADEWLQAVLEELEPYLQAVPAS